MGSTSFTEQTKFFALNFAVTDLENAVAAVLTPPRGVGEAFHLVNAYTIACADQDPALHRILSAGTLLTDGAPLARLLRRDNPVLEQVRGPSLMTQCLQHTSSEVKHFLLGGTEETLQILGQRIQSTYPNAQIAGSYAPPFVNDTSDFLTEAIVRVNNSGAHVVWVGLGTPKQDFMVHDLAQGLAVNAVAVGAALDYLAGTRKEAPRWIQGSGLEWFYRLVVEPRRLIGRYSLGNLRFLKVVIIEKISRKNA